MQKYWAARYPLLDAKYTKEEVDKTIIEWFDQVQKPVDPYSDDPYNIPLPIQTDEEIQSILQESELSPKDVPLPPQTDEELRSLQDGSRDDDLSPIDKEE